MFYFFQRYLKFVYFLQGCLECVIFFENGSCFIHEGLKWLVFFSMDRYPWKKLSCICHVFIFQGCLKCDPECVSCVGPGIFMCTECHHYREDSKCVSNCSKDYFVDGANSSICRPCDSRCSRCFGPTESDCFACKHFKIFYMPHSDIKTQEVSSLQVVRTAVISNIKMMKQKLVCINFHELGQQKRDFRPRINKFWKFSCFDTRIH